MYARSISSLTLRLKTTGARRTRDGGFYESPRSQDSPIMDRLEFLRCRPMDPKPRPNDALYLQTLRLDDPRATAAEGMRTDGVGDETLPHWSAPPLPGKIGKRTPGNLCKASARMSQLGLLKQTAVILTQLRVPFMLSGSHAASLQGEPRTTHDIDVVVDLSADKIDALVARFPAADFYVNCAAVHQAVATRGMFNIIDLREGDKVDFWLLTDDRFDRSRFAGIMGACHAYQNMFPPSGRALLTFTGLGSSLALTQDLYNVCECIGRLRLQNCPTASWRHFFASILRSNSSLRKRTDVFRGDARWLGAV